MAKRAFDVNLAEDDQEFKLKLDCLLSSTPTKEAKILSPKKNEASTSEDNELIDSGVGDESGNQLDDAVESGSLDMQWSVEGENLKKTISTSLPKSKYLNFDFETKPEWHGGAVIKPNEMIDFIMEFLRSYRKLTQNDIDQIRAAGVYETFQTKFVYKMCIEEAEGVQTKGETEMIGRTQNPSELRDPNHRTTADMFGALKKMLEVSKNSSQFKIRREDLLNWHGALFHNASTEKQQSCNPGILRTTMHVYGSGHRYVDHTEVELAVEKYIAMFNEMAMQSGNVIDSPERLEYLVKWAAWSLMILLAIHPFVDGNGRVCRLLCNFVLSSIFPFEVPIYNVHSSTTSRTDYIIALVKDQSCWCTKGQATCLNSKEVFDRTPSNIATLVLESCWRACQRFCTAASDVKGLSVALPLVEPWKTPPREPEKWNISLTF